MTFARLENVGINMQSMSVFIAIYGKNSKGVDRWINSHLPLVQSDINSNRVLGSSNARRGILDYANEV